MAYLWCQASHLPAGTGHSLPDDLGLSHQHIHQVPTRHQVKQEVQMVLVLKCCILPDAEWVCCVLGDGLKGRRKEVEAQQVAFTNELTVPTGITADCL